MKLPNITSTFSIVGFDPDEKNWGIAVATNELAVGNSTIYIEAGVGAIAVIADTEPKYGIEGLKYLKAGFSPQQLVELLQEDDEYPYSRQLGILNHKGEGFALTGSSLKYWVGDSGHYIGKNFVIIGNSLKEGVLDAIKETFEKSEAPFPIRLVAAIKAGEEAGGQVDGKQSAAIMVKGENKEWHDQIDLRVDHSKQPIDDLQQLLNYHLGRKKIKVAVDLLVEQGPSEAVIQLLEESEKMVKHWYGMYEELISLYFFLDKSDKAVALLDEVLENEPKFKTNLPSFHAFAEHPALRDLIDERNFSERDWIDALSTYLEIQEYELGLVANQKAIAQYPNNAYLYFMLSRLHLSLHNEPAAKEEALKAQQLDSDNEEIQELVEWFNTNKPINQ